MERATPKVVIYGTVSLDGRLTLAPDVLLMFGDERWDTAAGSSGVYEWLKHMHQPQVFLEGSGSLVTADAQPAPLPAFEGDPEPLYEDFLPEAVVHRPGHRGWFAMVDSRGRVRNWVKAWPGEEWAGWHLLVLIAHHTPPAYVAYLRRETIPYLVAGEERVDLCLALEKMASRLGVTSVFSTSPGKLGGALLRAGLVDEIDVEFFPGIVGGFETPCLFESPELKAEEWPTPLTLLSVQVQAGGRVWLRYQVASEWA